MKVKFLAALLVAGLLFTACAGESGEAGEFETQNDSLSYALGADIGNSLARQDIEVNGEFLYTGLMDAISEDRDSRFDDAQLKEIITRWRTEMQTKMMKKREESSKRNLEEGQKFLEENAKEEGVKQLKSGLQYKVIKEGTGKSPDKNDKVKVHYTGKLLDGTVFDSSVERGQPAEFPVSGVIPGWTEALQKMKEGGKWKLFIPPSLAYGAQGAGQKIGPNATLIFDVELLEVQKVDMPKGHPKMN